MPGRVVDLNLEGIHIRQLNNVLDVCDGAGDAQLL
jgi:hypothetical protein